MKSLLSEKSEAATSANPGTVASFIRFVVFGGGIGVLCSFAVPLLAMTMPWAASNAIITIASTLLCTELHARFTFAKGRGAGWREHWQSASSATAAYLATSAAIYVLHVAQPSPGTLTEQIAYLSASALAGTARFIILRLYVFACRGGQTTRPLLGLGLGQGTVAVPDPTEVRQPSCTSWPNGSRPQLAA
ncbi:GtrA family protein [Streptomyces sp. NPDC050704]|uniref:GtrA family protein n=1 Tax=Streptomyces sp. NPDC050704 TaxID=3157219 RepID=UPI00341C630C